MAVASLVVNLQANTAAFASAMGRARNIAFGSMGDISRSAKILGTVFAAAAAGIGVALGVMIKRQIDAADAFAKMSDKTGVSVETLSVLKHAADLAGASMEQVTTALARLSRSAFDAAAGGKEAQKTFQQLGVVVTDANDNLRSTDVIFEDVIEALGRIENSTARSALAQKVFGKSAAELQPLLKALAKGGFEAARIEAEKLGLVFSTKAARAAEQFNDNLQRLGKVLTGFAVSAVNEAIPALAALTDQLIGVGIEAVQSGKKFGAFLREVTAHARLAAGVVEQLVFILQQVAKAQQIEQLKGPILGFRELQKVYRETADGLRVMREETAEAFAAILNAEGPATSAIRNNAAAFGVLSEETDKEAKKQREYLAGLREEVLLHGLSAVEVERHKAAKLGLGDADQRAAGFMRQLITKLQLTQPLKDWATIMRGETIPALDELAQSAEIARNAVAGVNEAFLAGPVAAPSINVVVENLKKGLLDTKALADILKGGFIDLFDQAIQGGRRFIDVLKDVILSVIQLIAKLLIVGTLEKLLGGLFGGGSFFGSLFGGKKQFGGPVDTRHAFLVGEAGPELFVPPTAGKIVPLNRSAAGGGTIINIDARGADAGVEHKVRRALAATYKQSVRDARLMHQDRLLRNAG